MDDVSFLHFLRDTAEDRVQVDWSRSARLPINLSKCEILDFVTKKKCDVNPVVTEDYLAIRQVRFLSSVSPSPSPCDLKWNSHIETKASKRFSCFVTCGSVDVLVTS